MCTSASEWTLRACVRLLLIALLFVDALVICAEEAVATTTLVPLEYNNKDHNNSQTPTTSHNEMRLITNGPSIEEVTHPSSTILPSNIITSAVKKDRALDFDLDNQSSNNLSNKTSSLSDVSMDDDDENDESPVINAKILSAQNITLGGHCVKGGLTYENGEKLEVDCDQVCTCSNGKMDCVPRCSGHLMPKGRKIQDPYCQEVASHDHCCSLVRCATVSDEPEDNCHYKNKTYRIGESMNEGCERTCSCETNGKMNCTSRCKPITKTSDKCLEIPDESDPCCKRVICDVTLKDNKLIAAKFVNDTTIKLEFESKLEPNQTLPLIDVSDDKNTWKTYTPLKGGYLSHLDSNTKFAKIENSDDLVEIQPVNDEESNDTADKNDNRVELEGNSTCTYKNKQYKIGEEFNDACESFCVCEETGVKCLKMECPTFFGTDVLDPNCIEWETVPANFTAVPPKCCPDKLHCKNNGSCVYKDIMYPNWHQIPTNVTGCEKRCYCEMGTVECQNVCPSVPSTPPENLDCPIYDAFLSHLPGDDCCMYWLCKSKHTENSNNGGRVEVEPGDKKTNVDKMPFPPHLMYPEQPPTTIKPSNNNVDDHMKPLGPLFITPGPPSIQKPGSTKNNNKPYTTKNTTNQVDPPLTENDTENTYLGPFNPSYKPKPPKPSKIKPNNNFVSSQSNKNIDSYNPQYYDNNYHDVGQRHPVNGYPVAPVIEIHDYSEKQSPHLYPNNVPGQTGQNIPSRFPPGISLEQILQEIHKTGPLPTHPGFPEQATNFPRPYLQKPQTNLRPQQGLQGLINGNIGPGNFPLVPDYQMNTNDVNVHTLEAIDAHTVRLGFTVPQVIVGLHGRVEVKYTDKNIEDVNAWEHQMFAPPNDLIATPHLEFDLVSLRPNTEYRIKIAITLHDLHNTPTSKVYKIRTLKETTPTPTMIPIEPELSITEINATWVNVAWRKFTENEMQFIDGVQLRFKEIDGKIYAATPLIHRAVTNYTLENLKPNAKYEIGIFFIPFAGQHTELHAEHMLHFTTANEIDTYGFQVMLEITLIKATNVEISWSGVPYPEDKYVNIYRAIYQSDSGKGDSSTFKVAKRDSSPKTSITDLKPGTRYRLWLEIYLTNGKIKTSNVQDFITKPQSAPNLGASYKTDKLSGNLSDEKGDYYGSLVIVAILAAIAILSTIVLLLILVRRHGQNKACITPPTRISQSAYDNPTYKVEIQQETMDL